MTNTPPTPPSLAAMLLLAHGEEAQMRQTIEELAELIVGLSHHRRGRIAIVDLCPEIADVEIMLEQIIYLIAEVDPDAMSRTRQRKRALAIEPRIDTALAEMLVAIVYYLQGQIEHVLGLRDKLVGVEIALEQLVCQIDAVDPDAMDRERACKRAKALASIPEASP